MKLRTLLPLAAGAAYVGWRRAQAEPYSFNGKSVLITGGTRGLGLVMARLLAEEGARLTVLARDRQEVDSAARELESLGAEVLALRCDVTDRDDATNAVRQAVERFGSIDVLINNAGIVQVGPFEHMAVEDFEQAMRVHMWGPLYTMLVAVPNMRRQRGGRIVNISSIGGKVAVPHLLPYSASKFALTGLSDGVRAELAKDGIKVTTVAPGLMRTGSPFNAKFKGRQKAEFAWFVYSDTLPVSAIGADRAARQIIEACREGRPELTITIQARLAVLANALAPSLFARAMQLYAAVLPRPTGEEGDQTKSGWEGQSSATRTPLTEPTFQAAQDNNELAPSPDGVTA